MGQTADAVASTPANDGGGASGVKSRAGLEEASKGLGTEEIRPRMASNVGFECVSCEGIHVKHRPRRGLERIPNRGNPAWTALDASYVGFERMCLLKEDLCKATASNKPRKAFQIRMCLSEKGICVKHRPHRQTMASNFGFGCVC